MNIETKANEIIEVKLSQLVEMQGAMKTTNDGYYEKFKSRVSKVGFKYAFYGWRDPDSGKVYILDGHHRKKYLKRMALEGYNIPTSYQCVLIQAGSIKEAAEELLYINSKYSDITTDGILEYIKGKGLDLGRLADINIKELVVGEMDVPMLATANLTESQNKRFSQLITSCRVIAVGCIAVQIWDDAGIGAVKAFEAAYKDGKIADELMIEKIVGAINEILA